MAFDNIFEIMKERGLTAYRVSKDTGISQASIADWRKGRSKPKIDKLKILAEYFGVSLASLTGESSEIDDTKQIQAPNGYYVDKETAEYAEMLRTRPSARLLSSLLRKIYQKRICKRRSSILNF